MISKNIPIATKKRGTSQIEFILLMACLMSIVALSIDTILPALKPIGLSVGTANAGENQRAIRRKEQGILSVCAREREKASKQARASER